MRWTERWIAHAQRKADLRDEQYRRRAEDVDAGKRPPGLMDRLAAREQRAAEILEVVDAWYQGGPESRMRLADEVYALLRPGRACGPDGVEVSICVRYAGPYWAGRWVPRSRRLGGLSLRLLAVRAGYRVHAQTMSGPLVKVAWWFPGETAATIQAVGLAKSVQRGGADALRQAARQIPAGEGGSEVIC